MNKFFIADTVYTKGEFIDNQFIEVGKDGKIVRIDHVDNLDPNMNNDATTLHGTIIPGLVNSHSHAFQVLLRGWGDNPKDFHDWVATKLYPLAGQITADEISTATKIAYAQMLRNGVTTVGEFHYLHNPLPEEDIEGSDPLSEIMIKAAQTTGIRQRFLFTGYDRKRREEQERFIRSPTEVIASLNRLHDRYSESELVHIGASPHSLHGASKEMITEMVNWARSRNEVIHIHLSEQKSDVPFAKELYGKSPVQFLHDEGLLSEDMAFVHAIWLDEDEIELMRQAGVKHVYNPLTNMALGDGIAPVLDYIRAGIPTAVGTDANISLDVLKEVRTVEWLQRVDKLEMGMVQQQLPEVPAAKVLFDMGTRNGGLALKLPIGLLEEGYYADFLVIDTDDISLRPSQYLLDQLISSASIRDVLSEVYVGGSLVYSRSDGFQNFNETELKTLFHAIPYGNDALS